MASFSLRLIPLSLSLFLCRSPASKMGRKRRRSEEAHFAHFLSVCSTTKLNYLSERMKKTAETRRITVLNNLRSWRKEKQSNAPDMQTFRVIFFFFFFLPFFLYAAYRVFGLWFLIKKTICREGTAEEVTPAQKWPKMLLVIFILVIVNQTSCIQAPMLKADFKNTSFDVSSFPTHEDHKVTIDNNV